MGKSIHHVLVMFLLFCHFEVFGQSEKLLPKPYQTTFGKSELVIDISKDDFNKSLRKWISVPNDGIYDIGHINIRIDWVDKLDGVDLNEQEAYFLEVDEMHIAIRAIQESGAFYALQTLNQLVEEKEGKLVFPESKVLDRPAFRIRGFMHDVGRSFIPVEELKKQIKILSEYKINVFHWHLTEDLAWRLESKVFPQLTSVENFERFPGEYYKHEDVKDLLEFARSHQVTIIPEIDMPGHSAAFERAFGYSMQSQEGKVILKKLLVEALALFEGLPFLHIGTDEVKFVDHEFVPEMVSFIRNMGFKVISWNPGWDYKLGEIDMLHLWSYRGKAQEGIPYIDSRFHYINHFDAFSDLASLFRSNVAGHSKGNEMVAGSVLAVWNDRKLSDYNQILRENNFYPLMLTFAERLWQGGGEGYFDEIGVGLPDFGTNEWESWVDFEERLLLQKDKQFKDLDFPYFKQSEMEWILFSPFDNHGDLNKAFPLEKVLLDNGNLDEFLEGSVRFRGAGTYLRHVWGDLVPALIDQPLPDQTAYLLTEVFSQKEQQVSALISFQDYSRSEMDLPPPRGKWDWKESQVWLNGQSIPAPNWGNSHTVKTHKTPLQNENWQSREAVKVELKKGWNRVVIKLPVGKFQTPQIRLVKWMFNFVLIDKNGKEIKGEVIYDK